MSGGSSKESWSEGLELRGAPRISLCLDFSSRSPIASLITSIHVKRSAFFLYMVFHMGETFNDEGVKFHYQWDLPLQRLILIALGALRFLLHLLLL